MVTPVFCVKVPVYPELIAIPRTLALSIATLLVQLLVKVATSAVPGAVPLPLAAHPPLLVDDQFAAVEKFPPADPIQYLVAA